MKGFKNEGKKNQQRFNSKEKISNFSQGSNQLEIIKKAFQFHAKGNILEAAKYYQYFLDQGYLDSRVLSNYGAIYRQKGETDRAIELFEQSIRLFPNSPEAYANLANILKDQGKLEEAELLIYQSIELNPDIADSHFNLGNILRDLGKVKEAELSIAKAIKINPNHLEANNNLGSLFREASKFDAAEKLFLKSIEINPNYALAYHNLGELYFEKGNYFLATNYFKNALKLNPENQKTIASLIYSSSYICDFKTIRKYISYVPNLGKTNDYIYPFHIAHLEDDPSSYLLRVLNLFDKKFIRYSKKMKYVKKNKIHIGYFSADFHNHPVMKLLARVFELHDKSKFCIYVYSLSNIEDNYTERLKNSCSYYRNIKYLTDIEAVDLVRNDQLDIAIDLMGYTKNNRMPIFSYRVAPLQVSYLGYEASTGSTEMDYIIADKFTLPHNFAQYYSEKVIYKKHSYICFDDTKVVPSNKFKREEFGLTSDAFVLAAFHNSFKITPLVIDSWSRILKQIPHAILWISSSNTTANENIKYFFREKGLGLDKLVFANRVEHDIDHLSRHLCADIFLDTFNFTAASTALESLWAGLPVVSLLGKTFLARISSSFLFELGLSELIAKSVEEYEDIVINLAKNPRRLEEIKNLLQHERKNNVLFNSYEATRNLEQVYFELLSKL
ncbi:tetratricopeptide repeat protein [Prochlorococcus marinus]|uniref:O-linked N-acetylglucosamine transferase, SPINDLY family protein n=1 Tax=Prochlorococcus marinus TaxID=1219 RepID=UPI0022B4B413|nr:tetratricopeptide repeat protein [Prochlorococcus marinus]